MATESESSEPSPQRPPDHWKVAAKVIAVGLVIYLLVAYVVMCSPGIGPVGNLVAHGVIEEGERVVLADFDDTTGEGLGAVVTEALRVDLVSAAVLRPVERTTLEPTLELMQLEPGTRLTGSLAREVAVRDGIGAVLEGGVARAGTGYVITASLTEASTGRSLATFRVSAEGPEDVIASIDRLSQDVREKSGESLRSIRAGEPLEQVTTASLEALRLYSEAEALWGTAGGREIELLEQAVAIDTAFAMAWRKLTAAYTNARRFDLTAEASRRAYEHRDRLTERERHLTEANYYNSALLDDTRTIAAYLAVLRIDPDNGTALNNIANSYNNIGELDEANSMLRRAVAGPGTSNTAHLNLVMSEIALGRYEGAAEALREYEAAFPDAGALPFARFHVALFNGASSRAAEIAQAVVNNPAAPTFARSDAAQMLAKLAYREGRRQDARAFTRQGAQFAAQVSPALETLRWVVGSSREAELGDVAVANDFAAAAQESDGLHELPMVFTDVFVRVRTWVGRTDDASALLAEAERRGPAEYAAYSPLEAGLWLRLAEDDTAGLAEELEETLGAWGCTGRYCAEQLRAEVALVRGDVRSASELLEQAAGRGSAIWPLSGITDVTATLRLGPLYEQLGDTTRAIEAYQRMIAHWENGDAAAQARAADFRARVRALGG